MALPNLESTLRARVTPEIADAFAQLCKAERTTSSDKLRALVEAYVANAQWAPSANLDVLIDVKRAPQNNRYVDTAYYISARLTGDLDAGNFEELLFHLPEFFLSNGIEQCRVDSAFTHRVDGPEAATRRNSRRQLISTKLIDYRWEGGIYIYHLPEGESEETCIERISTSLKANILEAASYKLKKFAAESS